MNLQRSAFGADESHHALFSNVFMRSVDSMLKEDFPWNAFELIYVW